MRRVGELDGPTQAAECGAHGPYVSTYWTMPIRRGTVTSWSGCPRCILEREQAKRGYGKARFRYPHRPDYHFTTVINGVSKTGEDKS